MMNGKVGRGMNKYKDGWLDEPQQPRKSLYTHIAVVRYKD